MIALMHRCMCALIFMHVYVGAHVFVDVQLFYIIFVLMRAYACFIFTTYFADVCADVYTYVCREIEMYACVC